MIENAHKYNYTGIGDQREFELEKFLKEVGDDRQKET